MKAFENIILQGDCIERMHAFPDGTANTCVTSPPYFGLRDYGVEGQIGLEETPDAYVSRLVDVFREVRRVLREDGTVWLNLGDSYCNSNGYARAQPEYQREGRNDAPANDRNLSKLHEAGIKTKDLIGIPWRVAFALQADGWYLRQDIIWAKPNPMPESVTDRCTKSHEYIFLLSKNERYYFDNEAIKERAVCGWNDSEFQTGKTGEHQLGRSQKVRESVKRGGFDGKTNDMPGREAFRAITETRNKRDVWTVATKPYSDAHFATFPPALIEPCILAGCPEGGIVLDPFMGSGTTASVAIENGRKYIGTELNPEYITMAKKRILNTPPSLFQGATS